MYALWVANDNRFSFSISDNGGVAITDQEWASLISDQESGKIITKDSNGYPVSQIPPAQPMQPNGLAFIQSVKNSLGGIAVISESNIPYSAFVFAVQDSDWADMQILVTSAKTNNIITSTQYDAIKSSAITNNIPVSL